MRASPSAQRPPPRRQPTSWPDKWCEWPYEAGFQALSYPFRVRASTVQAGEMVERLLGHLRADSAVGPTYSLSDRGGSSGRVGLRVDGRPIPSLNAPEAFRRMLWHVLSATTRERDRVLLHAAAVRWADGAVLLPGGSSAGKTVLAAALVRAGFAYLADEVAAVDPQTTAVQPLPTALTVHGDALDDGLAGLRPQLSHELRRFIDGRWPLRPEDIRADAVGRPTPLRWVVIPVYRPGAATRTVPLDRGDAVALLAGHVLNRPTPADPDGDPLVRALAGARCYRLETGALQPAVEAVHALVERPPRPTAGQSRSNDPPDGEIVTIPERIVVSPGGGRVRHGSFSGGEVVRPGTQVGWLQQSGATLPLVAGVHGTFLSWLAWDGLRVLPGQPLARLRCDRRGMTR
ncbi:MAG TPA: hypothetical protein VHF25_01340 [Nitriliruptorales bacterium]|nr:hypothetical protein [Nitriliruptorales bacterium]